MLASERSSPPKPDRPTTDQVADDDPVTVPPADGDLVDADDRRCRRPGATELLAHVFDLQGLDRLPVQAEFASYILDSRGPTAPTHVEGEALGVKRVVGQPVQRLLLHCAAAPAGHATALELQVHPSVTTGEIAHATELVIVESSPDSPAGPTGRFFSPAHEANKTCLGISEETADHGFRTESGEAIRIIKPAIFSHSFIMPVHSPLGESRKTLET